MKDAYYFPHDSNARHDPKILAMRSVYGSEGYGWYWIVVEMLREQTDYCLPLDKYIGNALAMQMQCAPDAARKFIDDCISEFHLFTSDGEKFWSESLRRRMEKYDRKAEKAREAARARWGKESDKQGEGKGARAGERLQCERNANAMQTQCDGNASKVKESRVQESRVPPHPLSPSPPADASDVDDTDPLPPDPAGPVVRFYIENFAHTPSPYQIQKLTAWIDQDGMEPELVLWAMEEALRYGGRNLAYIESILADCRDAGVSTRAAAEARKRERERAREAPRFGGKAPPEVRAKVDGMIEGYMAGKEVAANGES